MVGQEIVSDEWGGALDGNWFGASLTVHQPIVNWPLVALVARMDQKVHIYIYIWYSQRKPIGFANRVLKSQTKSMLRFESMLKQSNFQARHRDDRVSDIKRWQTRRASMIAKSPHVLLPQVTRARHIVCTFEHKLIQFEALLWIKHKSAYVRTSSRPLDRSVCIFSILQRASMQNLGQKMNKKTQTPIW